MYSSNQSRAQEGTYYPGFCVDDAALKVVRRKLNTIGNMHGHCAVLNGAENLKRLRDDLQITDAIANIFRGEAEASDAKREEEEENIISGAVAAATKLEEKHRNVSDLTVKYIKSLLFAVYNVIMSDSNLRKPYYVACLMAEVENYISKCEIFLPRTYQVAEKSNTAEIPV